MRPLSAEDVLRVWERGRGRGPAERALTLLAFACPEMGHDERAGLPIGRRDAALIALRQRSSSARLRGFVECPECGGELEFEIPGSALAAPDAEVSTSDEPSVSDGGWDVRFRLPDSRDLLALERSPGSEAGRRLLLERCVTRATRDGEPVEVADLPDGIVSAIAGRMLEHDPLAEILIELVCESCSHRWKTPFDIVSFFWAEIETEAVRLLRQVDALARAYGWHERDILAMDAARRQAYLQLVGS